MSLIRWTPLPFVDPFDEMEKNFDKWPLVATTFTPAIDVYEDKDDVVVEAPLVGINPDQLEISVENGVLTIKGENEKKSEVDEKNYYRKEIRYGNFYRSISLPTRVNSDSAKATYDKGVLTIRIPKAEEAKPKTIKVDIKK